MVLSQWSNNMLQWHTGREPGPLQYPHREIDDFEKDDLVAMTSVELIHVDDVPTLAHLYKLIMQTWNYEKLMF